MAIEWPDALVTELAERRCVIVMGAGVSLESLGEDGVTHPPGWRSFLVKALDLLHSPIDQKAALSLINKSQFLEAAEIIQDRSNAADFSDYLRQVFIQPRFSPSPLHKIILDVRS